MSKLFDALCKSANSRLQRQIGAVADGYWGDSSQKALIASGRKVGYDWAKLRAHFGGFSQNQVDGFNAVMDAVNEYALQDGANDADRFDHRPNDVLKPPFVAYMLATAWHETAHTMQPIREYGRGKGRKYGSNIDVDGSRYQGLPHRYYGRGYVQLTWLSNYVTMTGVTGADLVNNPDLALRPDIAAKIMIDGMLKGRFTAKSLYSYINYGLYFEFVNARRVINGTDKNKLIAEYAAKFLDCLVIV